MEQVIEKSDRIILRPTNAEDLDFVLEAENAPENCEYVAQWTSRQHLAAMADDDICHITVVDSQSRQRIGYAILAGLKSPHLSIELRRIVITAKGKGYGREALELIKRVSFGSWNAHRLWLDVRIHNERAIQLYSSVGFVEEGTLRECVLCRGKFVSIIVMSVLRNEYEAVH